MIDEFSIRLSVSGSKIEFLHLPFGASGTIDILKNTDLVRTTYKPMECRSKTTTES